MTRFEGCSQLDLAAAEGSARGEVAALTVLTPFDRAIRARRTRRLDVVSRRAWMHAFREAALETGSGATLRAVPLARLDLLAYQLEPAVEVIRHGATRLLLADAVGLGKTIQAGIILAELRDRLELERALILTPPGLRDQWAAELHHRFALDATIADGAWLRATRAEWPAALNPWSMPGVLIASVDFLKRPDVRRSLTGLFWDVVVIDEAHTASADSDRREAAHLCASRARRVLLLTATPHAGDDAAFDALTRIGSLGNDDPVRIFRRSREDAGLPVRRRVHLLRVRGSLAERAVHRALRGYVRAVWTQPSNSAGHDARLAMIVLIKRSLSGMAPLVRSLEARLAALGDPLAPVERQLILPWADDLDREDEAPTGALRAPGLPDPSEERVWLETLIRMAGAAEATDSKRRALRRLLGRMALPVIVFTEYRDTLASLQAGLGRTGPVAVMHGGLDRGQRRDIVDRFTRGSVRVLLATDAAGAGLNLQERCRVVVNLELPWNPMRLEQRIGRVDRIGQSGTVHAINLVGRSTAESVVLARLVHRLDRARGVVGSIEGVLGWSDQRVAGRWIGLDSDAGSEPSLIREPFGRDRRRARPAPRVGRPDRRAEAAAMVGEIRQLRALCRATGPGTQRMQRVLGGSSSLGEIAVAVVAGRRALARFRSGGVLALVRIDGGVVPVFSQCRVGPLRRKADLRASASAFLRLHGARVIAAARQDRASHAEACGGVPAANGAVLALRDARLTRLALAGSGAIQPGLFDRRADRTRAVRRRHRNACDVRRIECSGPWVAQLLFIAPGVRRP